MIKTMLRAGLALALTAPVLAAGLSQTAEAGAFNAGVRMAGSRALNAPCARAHLAGEWHTDKTESLCIFGAVARPGVLTWTLGTTLIAAIAEAGGATADADLDRVTVMPAAGGTAQTINVAALLRDGTALTDWPALKQGAVIRIPAGRHPAPVEDAVFRPDYLASVEVSAPVRAPTRVETPLLEETPIRVRILGAVSRPGPYDFTEDPSALQVLDEAGGLRRDAQGRYLVLVRKEEAGLSSQYLDLAALAEGSSDAPHLRDGDSLYVPFYRPSTWAYIQAGLGTSVSLLSLIFFLGA